jgi:hypothetical protein
MGYYRKKPVVIEARRLTDENGHELAEWCGGTAAGTFSGRLAPNMVRIGTLEGEMTANVGDWIIKGIQGEFYPCKSDIFEATYEKVADDGGTAAVPEVRGDEAP